MKTKTLPILSKTLLTLLLLTSCTTTPTSESKTSDESTSITSESESEETSLSEESESQTSETSEEESESKESESEEAKFPTDKKIASVKIFDDKTYHIGDSYHEVATISALYTFTDGTTFTINGAIPSRIMNVKDSYGNLIKKGEAFVKKDTYEAKVNITFRNTVYNEIVHFSCTSGLEEGYELDTIMYRNDPIFNVGDYIKKSRSINLYFVWKDHGKEEYDYHEGDELLELSLFEAGSIEDVIDKPLKGDTSYTFKLSYGEVKNEYPFKTSKGYVKLHQDEIAFTARDISPDYAPATGEVKVLVLPIALGGDWTSEFSDDTIENYNGYFFSGDDGVFSFKNYYETASYGQMNVSGFVGEVYEETSSLLTTNAIMNTGNYRKIFQLIANAVANIKEIHPEIDFKEFDINGDGCIDNIHLVTNFNTALYSRQTGKDVWATPLWPHMYQTYAAGNVESPVANVYSLTAIDHMSGPTTQIHEQGHIFGLMDYYDYSYSGNDYVGAADMQSNNVFDWNSYSKFSVGWNEPYVINGEEDEVIIDLTAASLNGACIVIPADYSTYNNSAYDEYFMLELFTPFNNNIRDWNSWYNGALGSGGVRLYHVDSRLYDFDLEKEIDAPYPGNIGIGPNNSYDSSYYESEDWDEGYSEAWMEFKQLCLIQKGGTDTFGNPKGGRKYLTEADLFKEGDVFTFDKYKHFLNKYDGSKVETMDNGEEFPYTIKFLSQDKYHTVVKISK